jgi:hypothetical protein
LISLHFNSFRTNVYKKTGGSGSAANPKVCQLVTRHKPRLRTRRNPRNPLALMELLHNSRTHRGWGRHPLFSSFSVASALKSPFRPAKTSSHSRKPIPSTSSLSLFTTRDPLLTRSSSFQGKIYPQSSRSHNV